MSAYQEFTNDRTMVALRPGDVVALSNGEPFIVEMVNASRARCVPLTHSVVTTVTLRDKPVRMTQWGDAQSISTRVPPELLLERAGADLLNLFLAVKGSRGKGSTNTGTEIESLTEDQIMEKVTSLPRGGLAAEAIRAKAGKGDPKPKATKTKKTEEGTKGALGGLFGNSITSMLRFMGSKGFTTGQAIKALKANKIYPAEATVKIQLGRGKRKDGDLATVTKEQWADLVKAAGPAEAEKPKAVTKTKTKKTAKSASKKTKAEKPSDVPTPEEQVTAVAASAQKETAASTEPEPNTPPCNWVSG